MSRYRVELTRCAEKQLKSLDRVSQRRVQAALDLLADEPYPPRAVALKGEPGRLRVRVGDYRIIYEVQDGRLLVLVVHPGHRRDVYRR